MGITVQSITGSSGGGGSLNSSTYLDLSNCTGLTGIDLTGLATTPTTLTNINISGCTALEEFTAYFDNLVSIHTAGLTNLTDFALRLFASVTSPLTALDFTGCSSLQTVNIQGNSNVATLTVTGCSVLRDLEFQNTALTTVSLTGLNALVNLIGSNSPITTITIPPGATGLNDVEFHNSALTVTVVNNILIALDGFGTTNGYVDLSSGTNGVPSGAGATAKASLLGKSWTVMTN